MTKKTINFIGYIATAVVAAAFIFDNLIWLRFVNLIGCGLFIIYGALYYKVEKPLWPVIITNLIIAGIQFYHLLGYFGTIFQTIFN